MLHYINDVTLYQRCYTISTMLHYINDVTLYQRCYTISTMLHYIIAFKLAKLDVFAICPFHGNGLTGAA